MKLLKTNKPMAQQTAVHWLEERFKKARRSLDPDILSYIEQAKQMEREQKEECWNVAHQAGRFEGKGIAEENWQTFEQYYKETFGK